MRNLLALSVICLIAMTSVGLANPLHYLSGSYVWKNRDDCVIIVLHGRHSFEYKIDNRCDNSIDYATRDVTIDRNVMRFDSSSFRITHANVNTISGVLRSSRGRGRVTFVRFESDQGR